MLLVANTADQCHDGGPGTTAMAVRCLECMNASRHRHLLLQTTGDLSRRSGCWAKSSQQPCKPNPEATELSLPVVANEFHSRVL